MFQSVAAAEGCMTGRVSDSQPCRAGLETPVALEAAFLKFVIGLHEVMEAKHELVVRRTVATRRLEQADHALLPPALEAERLRRRQAYFFAKALEQLGERIGSYPNARFARIDIGEQAEDAITVGWPAGKGVDVEQIVARFLAQLARGLF